MNDDFLLIRTKVASHRLVLLHGWGANSEDLIPLGHQLNKLNGQKLEILSLRAPQIHPTGSGYQWYELFPANWTAASLAVQALKTRLKDFASLEIPLEKTFVLGFSQGGAMALASGSDLPLAGLICCSAYSHPGWIPPATMPPVIMFHGEKDEVVPISASNQTFSLLKESHVNVQRLVFDGFHEIPSDSLPRINDFILNLCL